jgi:hypothetical protein
MAKAANKAPKTLKSIEKYEIVEIPRSKLKNAPYNPRILTEQAKRKLKEGIRKHGILAPITWNARSGNIVSGHRRVEVMDALYGSKDYTLRVAKVELSDVHEREANILMNNALAQGEFDLEKLCDVLHTPDLDLTGAGFDVADVYKIFGDDPNQMEASHLNEMMGKLREVEAQYKNVVKKSKERDSTDYYCVVVFRNREHRKQFTDALGLEENRFVDGRMVIAHVAGGDEGYEPELKAKAKAKKRANGSAKTAKDSSQDLLSQPS